MDDFDETLKLQSQQHNTTSLNYKNRTEWKKNRFYLASGLDSLPDAEKADDPDEQQTQSQVPFDWTYVLYATADTQNIVSATQQQTLFQCVCVCLSVQTPSQHFMAL